MPQQIAKQYPRSLPYSPPPAPVRRRRRCWPVVLLLVTGVIAGACIIVGVSHFGNRGKVTRSVTERQITSDKPADNIIPVSSAATQPAPPHVQPNAVTTHASNDRLLGALGGLSAAHLYQTYLNIGMLADGVEGDIYSAEEGQKLLDTVIAMMETADNQLISVHGSNLKPEDQQALEHTRHLAALLQVQARELRSYWQTGEKDHATKFQKTREAAWAGIKELLDIKD